MREEEQNQTTTRYHTKKHANRLRFKLSQQCAETSPVCRELEFREGGSTCMPIQGRHLCTSAIGRMRWNIVHTFNSWFHALLRTSYSAGTSGWTQEAGQAKDTTDCGHHASIEGRPKKQERHTIQYRLFSISTIVITARRRWAMPHAFNSGLHALFRTSFSWEQETEAKTQEYERYRPGRMPQRYRHQNKFPEDIHAFSPSMI